jgi:NADH-quinone oxidoreductase subunit J
VIALLFAPTATMVPPGSVPDWSTPRIIFMGFAILTVLGALSTIMRKNDVAAVMSLVATFFGLAAVYTFLSAHFIAVLQVLVYAGAIMVLFIFVVMVLNRDETDPWVWRGLVGKVLLGAGPMVYLTLKLCRYLVAWHTPHAEPPDAEFGTVAQVGQLLFTDYLFAFEAVSVLLLIAVIAAVVVARTSKTPEQGVGPVPQPGHTFGDAQSGALYKEPPRATPAAHQPHEPGETLNTGHEPPAQGSH